MCHPLSPVIKLGFRHPRKKERRKEKRKKERKKATMGYEGSVKTL